jgi:OmpA-OmpF porin, OOP family
MKILTLFLVLVCSVSTFAQKNLNLPKDAKVEGVVTNMSTKEVLPNELIVFRSQKNSNEYQALSGADGKYTTRLPAGDKYDIYIMGFKDSTSYNTLEIEPLKGNSYYPKPFEVNIEFQPTATHIVLDNVTFETGMADLSEDDFKPLDELVDYLKRRSNEKVEIGGHTDNVGTPAKNQLLSLQRAQAIVAYLVAKGIDPSRVTAKGYGATQPRASNKTADGRAQNRRTEVKTIE